MKKKILSRLGIPGLVAQSRTFHNRIISLLQSNDLVTDDDTEELISLLKAPPTPPKVDKRRIDIQSIIRPTHYKIFIRPYLDHEDDKNFTFEGNVTIDFNVTKSTKLLIINSRHLKIQEPAVVVRKKSGKTDLKSASLVSRIKRQEAESEKPQEEATDAPKQEEGMSRWGRL